MSSSDSDDTESDDIDNANSLPMHNDTNTVAAALAPSIIGVKRTRKLIKPANVKSDVWKHFKVFEDDKATAQCNYCETQIKRSGGTGHLNDHYKTCQSKSYAATLRQDYVEMLNNQNQSSSASSTNTTGPIQKYFKPSNDFHSLCMKWIVQTKQPFETVENRQFRSMCFALNNKVEFLSVKRLKNMIVDQTALTEATVTSMLRSNHYAITNDSWTSRKNNTYTAITCHWIDDDFNIKNCALGCQPKEGRSQAVDHVNDIEVVMKCFDLTYKRLVASVTDTDATMIAAGRELKNRARTALAGDQIALDSLVEWIGCVDHILELTTAIAFKDIPESDGTMARCRNLVTFFNQSSQATQALLDLQTTMNATEGNGLASVNVIQDVATRW